MDCVYMHTCIYIYSKIIKSAIPIFWATDLSLSPFWVVSLVTQKNLIIFVQSLGVLENNKIKAMRSDFF